MSTKYVHAVLLINEKQFSWRNALTIECDREQMETDSDLIGQLPIIDRPASVVL